MRERTSKSLTVAALDGRLFCAAKSRCKVQKMICDFCSETPVYAMFDCRDLLHEESSTKSTGAWAICRGCAELVNAQDWDGVIERLIEIFKGHYSGEPDNLLRPQLVEVVNCFRSRCRKPS